MQGMLEKDVLSLTQRNMQDYMQTHNVQFVAQDAIFKLMATGEVYKGRAEIGAMLHYMYRMAFDAKAIITNQMITENKALVEGYFRGRHIGPFAGVLPTNKEVNVPLCVVYDMEGGFINEARIYMPVNVLMQQLNT
ncbi:MAG TPA: ester cyclase [Flavisolibacter sp.]|nr:ester cyclase [Flavisolibacter sp.]